MFCLALSSLLQHHPVENLGTLLSFQISRKAAWHTGKDVPFLIYLFPLAPVYFHTPEWKVIFMVFYGVNMSISLCSSSIFHFLVISVLRSTSPRLIAYATAVLGTIVAPLNK